MTKTANTNAWFSIALEYGLSIVSLGKPGGDEQLITGGLTAVETLLGTEIGVKQKEGFVVDRKTSRMERFPVDRGEGKKAYAQFFLMVKENQEVDSELIRISKLFIENLTSEVLESTIWQEIGIAAQTLNPLQIYDHIFKAYDKTHHSTKIRTDDKQATDLVKIIAMNTFSHSGFSEVLGNLAGQDYLNSMKLVSNQQQELMKGFYKDILAKLIQDSPLVFLYSSQRFLKTEGRKVLETELERLKSDQTTNRLNELVEELFSEDTLQIIMQSYDPAQIREKRIEIGGIIGEIFKEKIWQKCPLIGLINPTLQTEQGNLQEFVNTKVLDRVIQEYDLAGVISQIAENLINKVNDVNKLQGPLVGDFFRNLALRFPGGLPDQLWQIITQLLSIYAAASGVDIKTIPKIMEISDSHWKTISKRINRYKRFKPSELRYSGESGREVMLFFDGVREAIGRSFHKFYTEFIWDIHSETFGMYIDTLVDSTIAHYQSMQNIYCMINLLNSLERKRLPHLDPIDKFPFMSSKFDFIMKEYKGKDVETTSHSYMTHWIPSKIAYYFAASARELYTKEEKIITGIISQHDSYLKRLKQEIEKAKSSAPHKIRSLTNLNPLKARTEVELSFFDDKHLINALKQFDDIQKSLNEHYQSCVNFVKENKDLIYSSNDKELKSLSKRKDKFLTGILKQLVKVENKLSSIQNQFDRVANQLFQAINSEEQIISTEANRLWEKLRLKALRVPLTKGQISGVKVNMGKIRDTIVKEENKRFKGDALLSDKEFLYAYTSVYLFNSLDSNIRRKAIDIAIFSPKSSRLISEVIKKRPAINEKTKTPFDFLECLKGDIIRSGNEVFSLSGLIASMIRKSFSPDDYPLKAFLEQEEKLAVEIGTLSRRYQAWIDKKIVIHPRMVLETQDKRDIKVYYEVARRPSVGEITYLMPAIAISTYNNELCRLGLFIESLKMVASTLGEQERRRVQKLFSSLGDYLTGT